MLGKLETRYHRLFAVALLLYLFLIWVFFGQENYKFEALHLLLDTSNGMLSLLLALFLLAEQHSISSRLRNYLVVAFGCSALTEIVHALVGVEWTGSLAWIQTYAQSLRPGTWPPSTYVLPLALGWALYLKQKNSTLSLRFFLGGMLFILGALFVLAGMLPKYLDTGILGIQRPTQVPLLLLWVGVIAQCWRIRREHPLYEGLAWMGALLMLSDLCMLYSTSPHEKFTMMAHSGKLLAYILLHVIQMKVAAADSRARQDAEAALQVKVLQLEATRDEVANLQFAMDQHSIIGVTDVHGTITYVNNIFCEISGYTREELLGRNHRILNSGKHPAEFFRDMYRTIASGKVWHGDICNRAKGGDLYWVKSTIVPVMGVNGKPKQYIAMRTEITDRKNAETELLELAMYDTLTKLPNRRLLHERLEIALESVKHNGCFGGLIFLDLDHFQTLVNIEGTVAADMVLSQVSKRIQALLRAQDTVARIGEDAFVVLLPELLESEQESTAQARALAEKMLQAVAEPYVLQSALVENNPQSHSCSLTACIGLALFNGQQFVADDIIQMADIAKYQAKELGPNRIQLYQGFA